MITKLLSVLVVLMLSLHAKADLQWRAAGNGGAFEGVPFELYDGPFFLTDPEFTCPEGSLGPERPGYSEQIRLDHFGPNGCKAGECNMAIYARQSPCGGGITYLEDPEWSQSFVYNVSEDRRGWQEGFYLNWFEGKLYTKTAFIPDPDALPGWKNTWCESDSGDDARDAYEILIEEKRIIPEDGVANVRTELQASIIYKDVYEREIPFGYHLKTIDGVVVTKSQEGASSVYSTEGLRLKVSDMQAEDGGLKGTMTIRADGRSSRVQLSCRVANRN